MTGGNQTKMDQVTITTASDREACTCNNAGERIKSSVRSDNDNVEPKQILTRAERKSSSFSSLYKPEAFEAVPMMQSDSSSSEEDVDGYVENRFYYFEDDAADRRYKKLLRQDPRLWWCEICGRVFKNPKEFVSHHRRHISPELFRCPNCLIGFVDLSCCYRHEMDKHGKISCESVSDNFPEALVATTTNHLTLRSSQALLEVVDDDVPCSGICRTIPSTCVDPYRGPHLKFITETFDIEEKFGNHSRPTTENYFRVRRKLQEGTLVMYGQKTYHS